jgi:thiol-disulfide isomerase/thioredoxin
MVREASVVTPERFASGFTYQEYVDQIKVNKSWFEQLYDSFDLAEEDADFFRQAAGQAGGPAKMMVIGEDWCPDVYRGMPVAARIAEAGGFEMRVFPRDSHMDIMNEFLKEGKYASIPTVVFYTGDHRYIDHWIERPAAAEREMSEIQERVERENPDADEQRVRALSRPLTQERFGEWMRHSVAEIRAMLSKHLT